jgi:predicted nucleic acid-binding protein
MADLPLEKKDFLLDTCILQDLSSTKIGSQIVNQLTLLIQAGVILAISDYATYELLRGAFVKTEAEGEKVLNAFKRYSVSTEVLRAAARLDTLYKNDGIHSGISDGDEILAATSIIINAPVITRNGRDFPMPFFKEYRREIIIYDQIGRREKTTVLYFLEPDYQVITRRFQERQ